MKKINNYPRPQFVRENWLSLNGKWNFLFDDEDTGEREKYYNFFPESIEIEVPFSYETKKSGIGDETVHKNVWYQKNINISEINKNENIILHFEGSDYITKLWINGSYVGLNKGGYHRFSFDITDYLVNGENSFTIKVEDSLSKEQPRGKQRYKNKSWECLYVQTTGIWKSVWMERVPSKYFVSSKITPVFDNGTVDIELITNIYEGFNNYEIETDILFNNKVVNSLKNKVENRYIKYNMGICGDKVHSIMVWSPKQPNLYDIVYKLYYNGTLLDKVYSYFGVRKIEIEKNKLLLNNEELYLKMVLDQGYWEESHLTPPDEEAIIKDIEIARKYGFNGIRKHQKTEDERFLYYCDIKGMLVWGEMASCYEFTDESTENFTDEWIKAVKQNYNHPSIITWVPINESWGVPDIRHDIKQQNYANSLYYLTKSVDDTRPVISNDGWEHTVSDIITMHDYKQNGELLYDTYNDEELSVINNKSEYNGKNKLFSESYKYDGQPVIMSEYGGIALNSDKGWGYGEQVKDEEEFIIRFRELTNAIKSTKYISGYCYTQLTDTQQEINGLVYENRRDKFSDKIINMIKEINEQM